MVANDDPFVWFYYIYGFGILPAIVLFWIINKLKRQSSENHMLDDPDWTEDEFSPESLHA